MKEKFCRDGNMMHWLKCSTTKCPGSATGQASTKKKRAAKNWDAIGYIIAFKDVRQGMDFYHKVQQFGLQNIK
jgi:hypothetical protein